jgi:hypothetical protein
MKTLNEIDALARAYGDARDALKERVAALNDQVEMLKRQHLPAIKRAVAAAATRHDTLKGAIEESPDLFLKPKTVLIHGLRLGYLKSRGELAWDDPAQVVKLIRRHLGDQFENLVKVAESPIKSALAQLSAADLKRIGVMVIETGEQPFIKPTDTEIDRLVEALLREAQESEESTA